MPASHFYLNVPGWFDDAFREFYADVLGTLGPGSRVCEVGAWLGRSTAFLAVEAKPGTEIYVVDTWDGSPDEPEHMENIRGHGEPLYQRFLTNMARGGVLGRLCPIRMESTRAAGLFPDGYFDLVFIDAQHSYEAVKADVLTWRPKVKAGGILAGHDYGRGHPGVMAAVDELCPARRVRGTVWSVTTPGERPKVYE